MTHEGYRKGSSHYKVSPCFCVRLVKCLVREQRREVEAARADVLLTSSLPGLVSMVTFHLKEGIYSGQSACQCACVCEYTNIHVWVGGWVRTGAYSNSTDWHKFKSDNTIVSDKPRNKYLSNKFYYPWSYYEYGVMSCRGLHRKLVPSFLKGTIR